MPPIDAAAVTSTSARRWGHVALLGASFLFGTLNVVFRELFSLPDPPSVQLVGVIRSWTVSVCYGFLLLADNASRTTTDRSPEKQGSATWRAAGELALWSFTSVSLQSLGLKYVSSMRTGLLMQTSVIITPFLSVMARRHVSTTVWLGCCTALMGLVALSADASEESSEGLMSFSAGDILVLGGATCWSLYLFRSADLSPAHPRIRLAGSVAFSKAVLNSLWFAISFFMSSSKGEDMTWGGWRDPKAWGLLLYSAIVPGMLAGYLFQLGQIQVSASESSVILSCESVFTGLTAWLLLGEGTTPRENMGGAMIMIAAMLASGSFDSLLLKERTNESKAKVH